MFVRPSPGLVRHARQNHVGLQPDKHIRALRDDLSALDLAYPHPADRDLGAALGALHRTLVAYDGELPDLRDVVTEVAELSERVEDPTVAAAFRRKLALLMPQLEWIDRGQMRALHGGAHQGNVVGVEDELVWLDFEDACRGPVEYDLARMLAPARLFGTHDERELVAGYGDAYDPELLELWSRCDCCRTRRGQPSC